MSVRWGRIGVVAALVLVTVAAAVVWFSPVLSVRQVTINGAVAIPESEIIAAMDVAQGTPLLRVDTDAVARRIARIPRVASSHVQVDFPSTIRIDIVERTPTVFFDSPQGPHLMDSTGVEYAIGPPPPGVPRLLTAHPGAQDAPTRAALAALVGAPDTLRALVATISVRTVSDITLTLHDGRIVEWGSATDSVRKAAITVPLLTQPGHTYDVSSPDLPTIK